MKRYRCIENANRIKVYTKSCAFSTDYSPPSGHITRNCGRLLMEACFSFFFPLQRERNRPHNKREERKRIYFIFTLKIDAKMPDATVERDQVEQRIGMTAGAGPLFTTVRSVRRRVPPITPREDPGLVERSVFRMTKSAPSLLKSWKKKEIFAWKSLDGLTQPLIDQFSAVAHRSFLPTANSSCCLYRCWGGDEWIINFYMCVCSTLDISCWRSIEANWT